jgi:hypothetical protein
MIAYEFKSGRIVRLSSRDGKYSDPQVVSVTLECDETIQFGSFVYDAAIRWKLGETALFYELLSLLLREMMAGREEEEGGERETVEQVAVGEESDEEKQCDDVGDVERAHSQLGSPQGEGLVKLEPAVKFETTGCYSHLFSYIFCVGTDRCTVIYFLRFYLWQFLGWCFCPEDIILRCLIHYLYWCVPFRRYRICCYTLEKIF